MEVSLLLAEQILTMFLMGFLGFFIVKRGLLTSEDSRILSKICVYVCIPCMIVDSFQIESSPEMMSGLLLAFLVSVIYHILYIVFCRLFQKPLGLDAVEKASIIYSNVGSMIVPLVSVVFGTEWVVYACAFIIVQTVLIWTHGKALICHNGEQTDWKKILCNINIIAIVVGLLLFFTKISLPEILGNVTERLGNMLGPLSMLVIGMIIGDADLAEVFRNKRVYFICFLRLILCPVLSILFLLVSRAIYVHPEAHIILEVVVLAGASSSASTVTQMVQVFGENAKYASIINVMSVIFCVITMPVVTFVYEMVMPF